MMGLGSIVGTGVFVSLILAIDIVGSGVLVALVLAALVAICNGLNTAQLAADHPVSGGGYEYGYAYLSPSCGFIAGWLFICAKSASAAAAAQGFAGYLLHALAIDAAGARPVVALLTILAVTAVIIMGIRLSHIVNVVVVSVAIGALGFFIAAGLLTVAPSSGDRPLSDHMPIATGGLSTLLHAAAFMFVAYTGYGRIATLGEEVKAPQRTIPRAIVATLGISLALYLGVAVVALAAATGPTTTEASEHVAPLAAMAARFGLPSAPFVVAAGATAAMLGVLLNLLLGLSRTVLAMGRRGDLPRAIATVSRSYGSPWVATLVAAGIVTALVFLQDIRLTWSLSAFMVLLYYAISNLAALRLPATARLFPRWLAYGGLAGCLVLATAVVRDVWIIGPSVIAVGLAWHLVTRRLRA
jgi:APA family basic amino acid/polyamine antiporter